MLSSQKGLLSLNRLVKSELRVIEELQFEASFSYKIGQKSEQGYVEADSYQSSSYFYFPPQMRVSSSNYPIENFYRDMKSYINFRIPKLSYREMIGLTNNPQRSPLQKIRNEIRLYVDDKQKNRIEFCVQEARIFGCCYFNYLNRKTKKIQRKIKIDRESDQRDDTRESINFDQIKDSLQKLEFIYRQWSEVVLLAENANLDELVADLKIVDEYLLNLLKDFLLFLSFSLKELALSRRMSIILRKKMKIRLRGLRILAIKNNYLWASDESSQSQLEKYQYRRGLLKRRVWSALYLDSRVKPLFALQKQVGAMVAAGMAAVWAFMAEVTIRSHANAQGSLSFSIEASSFVLISAFALAYILKDRIKELGRGYFRWGIFRRVPDSSNKIIYPKDISGNKDLVIGNYAERARFVSKKNLPDDIVSIADQYLELDEEEANSVVCYFQRFDLMQKPMRSLRRKMRAVYNFYRLSIHSLLAPLDQASDRGILPTKDLAPVASELPKVYHIGLIIKIVGKLSKKSKPMYKVYRLVVNKQGILRVDNIEIQEP